MTDHLKHLAEGVSKLEAIANIDEHLYKGTVSEMDQARGTFESLLREAGHPGTPTYENQASVTDLMYGGDRKGGIRNIYSKKVTGYFEDNQADIFKELGGIETLAKYASEIKPMKTGEKDHDKAVEKHEKLMKLRAISEGYSKNRDYNAVIKEIAPEIKKDVAKKLSKETNPDNAHITGKQIEDWTRDVINSFASNPREGLDYLGIMTNKVEREFLETIGDKDDLEARGKYTMKNLVKAFEKGNSKEKEGIASLVANIAQIEKKIK